MRMKSEMQNWARGQVRGYFFNPKTLEQRGHFHSKNVITYVAADTMARLLGGDSNYVPGYMSFLYGASSTPGIALPEPPTDRTQTWVNLASELADPGVTGNVLITPLAAGPKYTVDGDANKYNGNAISLTAHTGSRLEYGFPTSTPFAGVLVDGNYFYGALLLTRLVSGSTITYLPFARVTLKGATYPQKLVGYELCLFWQISFF